MSEPSPTADEIIHSVARAVWFNAHDKAECPAERIPTMETLANWLLECPDSARGASFNRLSELYDGRSAWWTKNPAILGMDLVAYVWAPAETPGAIRISDRVGGSSYSFYVSAVSLEEVHAKWAESPDSARPRHPLGPVVEAWQQRPSHRKAFAPVKRAALPRFAKLGETEANLPDFPLHGAPPPVDDQLLLPGFGDAVRGCASWLLWLFDQAGGESLSSGRGAPWDLRMFVYALLNLNIADRDGEWHTLRFPTDPEHAKRIYEATGERPLSVEEWLHPNGWANKRRDWHKLPAALDRMRRELGYVPVDGIGRVAMLFPSVIPSRRGDPLIEFTVRVPTAAAAGDHVNWPQLLAYGADSARLFRAYLAVAAWLGRSARRGHPITRKIAAPVLGPDGKPRRRKGGAIIRSATEQIDNPARRYVAALSEADQTRMIGFDPSDRRRRSDARAAFERMEADGVIEIERSGRGWLLFGGPNW